MNGFIGPVRVHEGLTVTAGLCHQVEDELAGQESVGAEGLRKLTAMWGSIGRALRAVMGDKNVESVEVLREEVEALAAEIQQGARSSELLARVHGWRLQAAEKPLARLAEYGQRLAERLQKGALVVEVETHGVRLDPERWTPIWNGLVHVVCNAIDHGVEPPEERVRAGKPPQARLRLTTHVRGDDVLVEVQDDGRGIDWNAIRLIARRRGLPAANHADLLEVVLRPDVSTRQEVSLTSGRGLGLAALADSVRKLGGTISVESQEGVGTCWQLTVPRSPKLELVRCSPDESQVSHNGSRLRDAERQCSGSTRGQTWLRSRARRARRGPGQGSMQSTRAGSRQ